MLCHATKKSDGKPCTFKALKGSIYCGIHESRSVTDLPNELALNIMEYTDLNTLDILSKASKFGSLVKDQRISSRMAYLKKLDDLRNKMLSAPVGRGKRILPIADLIDFIDRVARFVPIMTTKKQYMQLLSEIYTMDGIWSEDQISHVLEYIATYSEQFADDGNKRRFDAIMRPMVKHFYLALLRTQ